MKELPTLLADRRNRILDAWRDRILATYPGPGGKLFKGKRGRFANPAGEIIERSTVAVLDGFLTGADRETVSPGLDELVRLRAVQEFSPAESVGFVFGLKAALREALEGQVRTDDLAGLDQRVDELALLAFDLYVACREKVYELRAKMMRDRSYMLMRRAGMLWEESGETDDCAGPETSERGDGR